MNIIHPSVAACMPAAPRSPACRSHKKTDHSGRSKQSSKLCNETKIGDQLLHRKFCFYDSFTRAGRARPTQLFILICRLVDRKLPEGNNGKAKHYIVDVIYPLRPRMKGYHSRPSKATRIKQRDTITTSSMEAFSVLTLLTHSLQRIL